MRANWGELRCPFWQNCDTLLMRSVGWLSDEASSTIPSIGQ
jgi:hypothetical protein